MALTLRDKEIISYSEKRIKDKANMIGADGYYYSEPFYAERRVALPDTFRQKPATLDGYGLVTPDYDDYPTTGGVGTRRNLVRLHPYLPSGKDGPSSVQTFIVVSSAPASNSISDIDAVRIKPLIGPIFSPDAKTAYEANELNRGFELALFPATDSGGTLVADTTNGPISPTADPSAGTPNDIEEGADNEGFWYVDYDNGIVRFSVPPLNGSGGVMNPNNVFGDATGATDATGAITMFATFYEYSGEFGETSDNFVTIGDGYQSEGTYEGTNHNVFQTALNTFDGYTFEGGVVFVKEGEYTFTDSVVLPIKTKVIGLSGAIINKPLDRPAFIINDGYSSIEGLEFNADYSQTAGAFIELRNKDVDQLIAHTTIKHNTFNTAISLPAIGVAPINRCTYDRLNISENYFSGDGYAISHVTHGGTVALTNAIIYENHLGNFAEGGIHLGHDVSTMNSVMIASNVGLGGVEIRNTSALSDISILNNTFGKIIFDIPTNVAISGMEIGSNTVQNTSVITTAGSITNLNMFGNIFSSGLIFNFGSSSSFSESNIVSNSMYNLSSEAFAINGVTGSTMTQCCISNNTMRGTMRVSTMPMTSCVVSGNASVDGQSTDGILIYTDITASAIMNNVSNLNIEIDPQSGASQTMVSSIFSGNIAYDGYIIIGNSGMAAGATSVSRSIVDSNIADDFVLYGAFANSSFSSNNAEGLIGIDIKNLTSSLVSSNTATNGIQFSDASYSVITGNTVSLAASILHSGSTTITSSIFSNNFAGTITLWGLTDSSVTGNSATTLNAGSSGGIVRSAVTGNSVLTTMLIGNSSASPAADRSAIYSNVGSSGSTLTIRVTGATPRDEVLNSTISGNVFDTITIGGTVDVAPYPTLNKSSFAGNWCETLTIGGMTNAEDTALNSSIDGNFIDGYFTMNGGATQCGIDSNYFGTGISLQGYLSSTLFIGNICPSTTNRNVIVSNSDGYNTLDTSFVVANVFQNDLVIAAGSNGCSFSSSILGNSILNSSQLRFYTGGTATISFTKIIDNSITDLIVDQAAAGTLMDNVLVAQNDITTMSIGTLGNGDVTDSSFLSNIARGTGSLWKFGATGADAGTDVLNNCSISNNISVDELEINGKITQVEINFNTFSGTTSTIDINGSVVSSQINGNNTDNINIDGDGTNSLSNSVVNDNILTGTLATESGQIAFSELCNNKIAGGMSLEITGSTSSVVNNSIIASNVLFGGVSGALEIGTGSSTAGTRVVYKSTIQGNYTGDIILIGPSGKAVGTNSVELTSITGNYCGGFNIEGEVLTSVISGNVCEFSITTGSFTSSVISSNVINDSNMSLEGSLQESLIADNYLNNGYIQYGDVGGDGTDTVSRFMSVGNYVGNSGGFNALTVSEAVFAHNFFNVASFNRSAVAAVATWTDVAFIGNYVQSIRTKSFRNTVFVNSVFSGNVGNWAFIKGSGASGGAALLSGTHIVGHNGDLTITWDEATSTTNVLSDSGIIGCVGALAITSSPSGITAHNLLFECVISGCNMSSGTFTIQATDSSSNVCSKSVISNNRSGSDMTFTGGTSARALYQSALCSNSAGDAATNGLSINAIVELSLISGNWFGTADINNQILNSIISNNSFDLLDISVSLTDREACNGAFIIGNVFNDDVTIAHTATSGATSSAFVSSAFAFNMMVIASVTFTSVTAGVETIKDSRIVGNDLSASTLTISHTAVSATALTVSDSCVISGNDISTFAMSTASTGAVTLLSGAVVSGNIIGSWNMPHTAASGSAIGTCSIVGNTVTTLNADATSTTADVLATSSISGNYITTLDLDNTDTSGSTGGNLFESCSVSGNYISSFNCDAAATEVGLVSNSTISCNWISSFLLDNADTTVSTSVSQVLNSTISGNVFSSVASITADGAITLVDNSVISGNRWGGGVTIRHTGVTGSVVLTNVSISGNTFSSTVTLGTSGETSTMAQSIISSNVFAGTFTIGCDVIGDISNELVIIGNHGASIVYADTSVTQVDVPSEMLMALNQFATYNSDFSFSASSATWATLNPAG